MISEAGRFFPMRSVARPGQMGLPAVLWDRHQARRTGKLCLAGSQDQ